MKGFTIYFAMLIGALALAVGAAIYDLTIRELDLSATATQSQYAIYAADTGAECALYWDIRCPTGGSPAYCAASGGSAFATSSYSNPPSSAGLACNSVDITSGWTVTAPDASHATTTFTITFSPEAYCATVEVGKSGSPSITTIISHGYNTCASGGITQLERTLQVSY